MELLKKLISIPSLSGEEQRILEYIFSWMENLGCAPKYVAGNVVATLAGECSEKAVVLNAHVDTVSAGDVNNWQRNPWQAWGNDDKLYGLGASDEKAGVAALMQLAKAYAVNMPPCDVWLTFVVKEEVDGSGSKEVMSWFANAQLERYEAVAGILVEPTGLEEMEIAHKGNVFLKLTTRGDSGHGSQPEKINQNAIELVYTAWQKIEQQAQEWQSNFADPVLGSPSISLTNLQAGSLKNPNKFADVATASLDVRTTPDFHNQAVNLVEHVLKDLPVSIEPLYSPAPFGATDTDDPIVLTAKQLLPNSIVGSSKGSTDQCFFTQHGIPAIVLGPGEKHCIHAPNEFCYPAKIEESIKIYQDIIQMWSKSKE